MFRLAHRGEERNPVLLGCRLVELLRSALEVN
jgi:hypothetical protein